MKKILSTVALFICIYANSQEKNYRIYFKDNTTMDIKNPKLNGDFTSFDYLDGNTGSVENKLTLRIRPTETELPQFEYKEKMLNEFVVVQTENKTAADLYRLSTNWIKETYKNPNEVIKSTIDNEMIRLNGVSMSGIGIKALGMITRYSVNYTISIYFKDNKYRIELNEISYNIPPSKYNLSGMKIDLKSSVDFYNKKNLLRSMYETIPFEVEDTMNNLNLSLFNYIKTPSISKQKDW
jgi:hypothetical protein